MYVDGDYVSSDSWKKVDVKEDVSRSIYITDFCCYRKLRKEQFIREKNDKLEYEP